MGTLKPGDIETLFRGLATSKGQGSDWNPGSLGRNYHTSSSSIIRLSSTINHTSHVKHLKFKLSKMKIQFINHTNHISFTQQASNYCLCRIQSIYWVGRHCSFSA